MPPPTHPVAAEHPLREDAWLAGFVAGEGCLTIRHDHRHDNFWPSLKIALRDDDGAILYECREAFGGHVEEHHSGTAKARGWNPQVRWIVNAKVDLMRLVAYFDRFPLRAKKADEYAVWRE